MEDFDIGELTAELTSRSNASRGSMSTRPCSQEANRNRNKKQDSNIKHGKSGKTSSKELYPLDQNCFETEEAILFKNEYEATSNFDFDKNLSKYDQGESEVCVNGRLKCCLHFWEEIGANENVLDVKENGYKIPFISTPKPVEFKSNNSALLNDSFVYSEITQNDTYCRGPLQLHVVSPLSVSTNKEKNCLILDLRYVNLHVWQKRVKLEHWKVFYNYLSKEGSIFSFDLKSGYHHVDIYPPLQTFLGFSWVVDGISV